MLVSFLEKNVFISHYGRLIARYFFFIMYSNKLIMLCELC